MKLAIIGSRDLIPENIDKYISKDVTEIISGGAVGVDQVAKQYALNNNFKYVEFPPEYNKYRRFAPLKRNQDIINYADEVLAFWDGKSKGTKYVIEYCKNVGKKCTVINLVLI